MKYENKQFVIKYASNTNIPNKESLSLSLFCFCRILISSHVIWNDRENGIWIITFLSHSNLLLGKNRQNWSLQDTLGMWAYSKRLRKCSLQKILFFEGYLKTWLSYLIVHHLFWCVWRGQTAAYLRNALSYFSTKFTSILLFRNVIEGRYSSVLWSGMLYFIWTNTPSYSSVPEIIRPPKPHSKINMHC